MRILSIFLTLVVLIAGVLSCAEPIAEEPVQYNLTIYSDQGGEVTTPGEGKFTYGEGTIVSLVAASASGHYFGGWTGDVSTIANTRAASTTITMNGDYSITATFQVIPVAKYNLTVSTTQGGSVAAPGQGTFTYDAGTVVELVAEAEEGYQFTYWSGSVGAVDDVNAAATTVTMMGDYSITASFAKEIRTWHDLDAIRDNLSGHYILMNDLDCSTTGYSELAGSTANDGKGWQPIGSLSSDLWETIHPVAPFNGNFDGHGYDIRDLFVSRPDEDGVGLFGFVGEKGFVKNVGVVNAEVGGRVYVGGLVGGNRGTVSNSHSSANVAGHDRVGGLVGQSGSAVSSSYSSSSVASHSRVGGLVGINYGTVSDSHFSGSVTGRRWVGSLVGVNFGAVRNSHYNHDEVLINGLNVITIGALFAEDFEEWLASDMSLDVNERLVQEEGYYVIDTVSDIKELLAFGQDDSLRFRLSSDLDLASEPNFYIPYLAGEFDGNGHKILNLTFDHDFAPYVGLFGYLASGGRVTRVGAENIDIIGGEHLGGLLGANFGTVSDSHSSGRVSGNFHVGGLVGGNWGTVSNSRFTSGTVTGSDVGGLVGEYGGGTISNSYYNCDEVLINGDNVITTGALLREDFEQWLANDKFLDINERLSQENGYYVINSVRDLRQLLAFGQDDLLKFRLKTDLDLASELNFYIPYFAGEFDGNRCQISNLSLNHDFVAQVGLFGYVAPSGKVSEVGVKNTSIVGWSTVGGLVGWNRGTVNNSHSSGNVIGTFIDIGGLVGCNDGDVRNSYSDAGVSGGWRAGGLVGANACWGVVSNSYSTGGVSGDGQLGGLAGCNDGTVSNSYATGRVTGHEYVGGLVGENYEGTVTGSFWDMETSGMEESDGGTGKTTAEMMSIATFSGAGWNIIAVASAETRNTSRVWNIVEGQTYPFLSWQPVS